VHIRLTLTRGVKVTSGMDPRLNRSGPTLIVLAEHKPPVYGLCLFNRPCPQNRVSAHKCRNGVILRPSRSSST